TAAGRPRAAPRTRAEHGPGGARPPARGRAARRPLLRRPPHPRAARLPPRRGVRDRACRALEDGARRAHSRRQAASRSVARQLLGRSIAFRMDNRYSRRVLRARAWVLTLLKAR